MMDWKAGTTKEDKREGAKERKKKRDNEIKKRILGSKE
jgi:hypothetical protein